MAHVLLPNQGIGFAFSWLTVEIVNENKVWLCEVLRVSRVSGCQVVCYHGMSSHVAWVRIFVLCCIKLRPLWLPRHPWSHPGDGLCGWQHLQTWSWQRVPRWGTNVMLLLQEERKEEKLWECLGVPCFDTNSPGSPWACHKLLLKGNSLQKYLQDHYGMEPTPALYRQNSWGKNRAELWQSTCSFCWVHCHRNID